MMDKIIMKNIDEYFNKNSFNEAVLIKYVYDSKNSLFELVTDFTNWDLPEGHREFKKLVFHGIRNYKRLYGKSEYYRENPNTFSIDDSEEVIIIQQMTINTINDSYFELLANMNYNFGGIVFEFEGINESKKIGVGKQISEQEWMYIDIESNQEFSFEKPFD